MVMQAKSRGVKRLLQSAATATKKKKQKNSLPKKQSWVCAGHDVSRRFPAIRLTRIARMSRATLQYRGRHFWAQEPFTTFRCGMFSLTSTKRPYSKANGSSSREGNRRKNTRHSSLNMYALFMKI